LHPGADPTAYFKGKFRDSDRFRQKDQLEAAPDPGSYNVQRLFDSRNQKPKLTSERAQQLVEQIRNEKGIK
jgi:hypothetical protein